MNHVPSPQRVVPPADAVCHACQATANGKEWLACNTPWGVRYVCDAHLLSGVRQVESDAALRAALIPVMKAPPRVKRERLSQERPAD